MDARHFRHWPPGLPRSLPRASTTLQAMLETALERTPEKTVCHFFGGTLSYRALWQQSGRLAGHLQRSCAVRPGGRVVLDLQNSPQFAVALFAILRAGAIAVPLAPMLRAAELTRYIEDSGATAAIIGQERWDEYCALVGATALRHVVIAAYREAIAPDTALPLPELVAEAPRAIEAPGAVRWRDALAAGDAPGTIDAAPGDVCALPYTSGSTGRPKGCMHTHASILHSVLGAVLWENVRADSVALATAPMFHVTGFVHSLLAPIHAGATIVIQPRWDARLAARLIEQHRCTHWANVPTMVVDLLSDEQALRHDVSSLANIFGGGASMPEAIAQKLHDRCGIHYMEGYGMTETISQTHMNPAHNPKKQCLGIPTFDTESLVIDPESLQPLAPGEAGEIVVRGPQLLSGYWRNEAAFHEAWVEIAGKRYLRTGDLGRMDEDGYFFIADRLKRMINAAGYKVWPAEVEAAMYHHPAIQECCVIATPDARRGESVKAVIALKPAQRGRVQAAEIIDWAHQQMAAYKAPRSIEFVDALPRSGTGKIQWRALQDREFA